MFRFSNFVKTGMEAYILAAAKFASQPGERHEVVLVCSIFLLVIDFMLISLLYFPFQSTGGGGSQVEWRKTNEVYTCMITKPKKESKLKGLKVRNNTN
jgi:hypothetical protein